MQLESRPGYSPVADKELFNGFERIRCDLAFFAGKQSRFISEFKGLCLRECRRCSTGITLQLQRADMDQAVVVGRYSVTSQRKTSFTQVCSGINQPGVELEETFHIAGPLGCSAALRAGNLFALCDSLKGGWTKIETAFATSAYESGVIGKHAEPPQKINISNLV